MTGVLNGGVIIDLVFSFFSSFVYPDLWIFDKNEKMDPIQCQPGPKVAMTFKSTFKIHSQWLHLNILLPFIHNKYIQVYFYNLFATITSKWLILILWRYEKPPKKWTLENWKSYFRFYIVNHSSNNAVFCLQGFLESLKTA